MAVKSANLVIVSLTLTSLLHIRFTHPVSQCTHQLVYSIQITVGLNPKSVSGTRDPKTNPVGFLLTESSQPNWGERQVRQQVHNAV